MSQAQETFGIDGLTIDSFDLEADDDPQAWAEVPYDAKLALYEWFNCEALDDDDKQRLAALWHAGQFEYWDCPGCEETCYVGDPESWDHFQGVLQLDYASYPGDSDKYQRDYLLRLCDDCRMQGTHGRYPPTIHCA